MASNISRSARSHISCSAKARAQLSDVRTQLRLELDQAVQVEGRSVPVLSRLALTHLTPVMPYSQLLLKDLINGPVLDGPDGDIPRHQPFPIRAERKIKGAMVVTTQ